jgi:uncharacterized membrane protein
MMWLSFSQKIPQFRAASHLVFLAAVVRLMVFDASVNVRVPYVSMFNERSLAFVVAIVAFYLAGYLMWRNRETLRGEWESAPGYNYRLFPVVANIFTLWLIAAETYAYGTRLSSQDWQLFFPVVLAGAMALYHLVWRRSPENFDIVLLVIDCVFYFILTAVIWTQLRTWMGSFYFALAFFHAVLAYFAARRGADYYRLMVFALAIALLFLTVAIPVQIGDKAWTTIAWVAQATITIWLSFRFQRPELRVGGYIVFAAAAARLLVFDSTVDVRTFTPVLNERFLAYIISIALMYLSGYLLWRGRESLWTPERAMWSVYPIFVTAANFFTVLLLSMELWGYFSREIITAAASPDTRNLLAGLRSVRNLSLTALWTVYAVVLLVVGIGKRLRPVRLAGLVLLSIPIIKVYVYDVFALGQLYRIFAFVGLGVLLVASGYLYQRYREAIRGFITEKS